MTQAPVFDARGLSKRFGATPALQRVDLQLLPGEVHALAGENGAGKSTLIKLMAGVYRPDAGNMAVGGEPYAPATPLDATRRGIRVVHQELLMMEHLSVAENVLLHALPSGPGGVLNRRRLWSQARELLAQVGLEDLDPASLVGRLGMAQRQLLEIAKALSSPCRVLILDEPTATLTAREAQRLFEIVRQMKARGVATLFVSHHLHEIFEQCDRVTILRNGARIATHDIDTLTPRQVVHRMVGHEHSAAERRHAAPPAPGAAPALGVRGLRYTGQPAGPGIDFDVHAGEVMGLAGLVGAGRTETLRAIFGADRKLAGTVLRCGSAVSIDKPADAIAHGICLVTENRKDEGLILDLPVKQNISLSLIRQLTRRGLIAHGDEQALAERMVRRLDVRPADSRMPPRRLSGGNQQKVVLAKWLARQPAVMLLDEPTRGVDVGAKAEIHALFRAAADEGMAVLMASSDIAELVEHCDRILVMSRGALAGELTREHFDQRLILEMAYSRFMEAPHAA